MSNQTTIELLDRYMFSLIELENNTEELREELCSSENFSLKDLFKYLDVDTKGFLSLNDFRTFLNEKGLRYCDDHLRRFIHNFDKNNDFALDIREFSNIILTRKNENLRSFIIINKNQEKINENILNKFTKILQNELNTVNSLAVISEKMRNRREKTPYEIFRYIDKENERYLNTKNILKYLNKNGEIYNEGYADDIVFRLSKVNQDNISYEDFQEIFTPIRIYYDNIEEDNRDESEYQKNQKQSEHLHKNYNLRNSCESNEFGNNSCNFDNKFSGNHSSIEYDNRNRSNVNESLERESEKFQNMRINGNTNIDENNTISNKVNEENNYESNQSIDNEAQFKLNNEEFNNKKETFHEDNIQQENYEQNNSQNNNDNYGYKEKNNDSQSFNYQRKSDYNYEKENSKENNKSNLDFNNSTHLEKLNHLNNNLEILQNKIKQTKQIGNKNRVGEFTAKTINIINNYNDVEQNQEDYRNMKFSNTTKEDFLGKNPNTYQIQERNTIKNYKSARKYQNNDINYEDLRSKKNHLSVNAQISSRIANLSTEKISRTNYERKINHHEHNQKFCEENFINSNNESTYKKNRSTSKLQDLSNYDIGYIPNELSRSPAMRKSIDRSKIIHREYGCYEKINRSRNMSVDSNYVESEKNQEFNEFKTRSNYYNNQNEEKYEENYYRSGFSPQRENDLRQFNSSNSIRHLSNSTNRMNIISKSRSPLRKELLYNQTNFNRSRSPYGYNHYKSDNREQNNYEQTNYFANSNGFSTAHTNNFYGSSSNMQFNTGSQISNLSVFSSKNEQTKIKSQNLAKYLYDLIIVDSICESNKESLSLRNDVSLRELFKFFDLSKRNSISLVDFKEILKELEIYVPLPELKLAFKRFDCDMDGRLEYKEFCAMVCPKKSEYFKVIQSKNIIGSYKPNLSQETKLIIKSLFISLIDAEITTENKKRRLTSSPGFSNYESYEIIKGKFKSFILKDDLNDFLHRNGLLVTKNELDILFDRLDKNKDGKISFNEFIHELIPNNN